MRKTPENPISEMAVDQSTLVKTREEIRDAVMLLANKYRLSLKSVIEAIQPDLAPDEEKQLALQIAQWFSELINKPKTGTEAASASNLGIQPTQIDDCLVPSGEGPTHLGQNESNHDSEPFGSQNTHPRTELAIEIIRSFGAKDIQWFKGKNEQGMIRMLSYNALVSKQLGKAVLVCNEKGNRTFVIHSLDHAEQLWKLGKAELMAKVSTGEVSDLPWQDPEEWKRKLGEMLDPKFVPAKITRPRDQAYYTDSESVKADMEAYAKKLGEGKTPLDLSILSTPGFRIKCSNGEEEVLWTTWLSHAAISLGNAKTAKQAKKILALTLKSLLKVAGYEIRDRRYYTDNTKIRQDLDSYAKELGEGKMAMDLNSHNVRDLFITCANGEREINGNRWLANASVALGISKNFNDAQNKLAETLRILLINAGYIKMERPPKDFTYFSNVAKLEHDLGAFASFLGIKIESLNTSNLQKADALCANGETLNGRNWLLRAAVALGMANNQKEACLFMAEILKKLKERIGILS